MYKRKLDGETLQYKYNFEVLYWGTNIINWKRGNWAINNLMCILVKLFIYKLTSWFNYSEFRIAFVSRFTLQLEKENYWNVRTKCVQLTMETHQGTLRLALQVTKYPLYCCFITRIIFLLKMLPFSQFVKWIKVTDCHSFQGVNVWDRKYSSEDVPTEKSCV